MKTLIGKKVGMTQVFNDKGACIPVTLIQVGRCVPVLERTPEKDGYQAVLVAYGERKDKHTTKPVKGFYEKHKLAPARLLEEFREEKAGQDEMGKPLKADIFSEGELVDVIGRSKGRGFAGVVKRHGFSGMPGSRGTHESFRGGGSVGMHTYPGRVLKGKGMPGRMGCDTIHVKNLTVVRVDAEQNIILLKGCVPGARGQLVRVTGLRSSKS